MQGLMMQCVSDCCAIMLISGVVFLLMQAARPAWMGREDISPRECVRFWRGVAVDVMKAVKEICTC